MPNSDIPQYLTSSSEGVVFPAKTMTELLLRHEKMIPDKVVYALLEDGINETDNITYSNLAKKARAIGAVMQEKGSAGDRVLLLFPTGIEFITAFYACFFAGMIAVPMYPPKRNKPNERFRAIVNDARPSFILTTRQINEELEKFQLLAGLPEIGEIIISEEVDIEIQKAWKDPGVGPDDLALIQYTSGSTGKPNGVMVSHGNIIHNSEFIKQSFGFDENSVGMNWLPNFHDMGLIGCLIQAAYLGATNVIIPPLSFLKSPSNWFRSISRYRATTCGGPNFALDYSLEKVADEELQEFDLSSLRTLYCGAEPVRQATLTAFAEKFKKASFRASQFFPVYGLAESVLIVSGGDYKAEPVYYSVDSQALGENKVIPAIPGKENRTLTACGYPWIGMSVAIVNPETRIPVSQAEIGEVWVNGPSVARGYWNESENTEFTFRARIEGCKDDTWLRTGDLGFIHEGQLYISGRLKDLIIIRGTNFFPNDIEFVAENSHPALRQNASAAFSSDIRGEERLVLVMEVERTHMNNLDENEVFEAIRSSVFAEFGVQPHVICLIRMSNLPKTSSGKIQRFATRSAWLQDELNLVAKWEYTPKAESDTVMAGYRPEFLREWIINWMAQKLELDPNRIDPDKPVSSYGLDSLAAVSLEKDVHTQFGVEWPLESFLTENSVNQLVLEGMELLHRKS